LEEIPNRELTLTIEKIVDEEVVTNGKSENCTVAHFTDKAYKPMILNVTNKKRLCKLYKTKETDKLKGKTITIKIEKVKAFGDVHDALRIKPVIPRQNASLPKCEKCGKDINAYGNMTPEQMAAYTKSKYNKSLCSECAMAEKGAE
jgi:ribosomal protein L34E